MKNILITGVNSYIGNSFEQYIKENDKFKTSKISFRNTNLNDICLNEFDVILHVAGIAHIKETKENKALYYQINRDLTIDIAKKAKNEGVSQFIFISSMSVYGISSGIIEKNTKCTPKSAYGLSKLEAEQEIFSLQDEKFKVCAIRPPMVYGKNCVGNYKTLAKFAYKLPVFPDINNKRSMIFIDNLCEFIKLVIKNNDSGIFMPQNEEYVQTSKMVSYIAFEKKKKIVFTKKCNILIKILCRILPFANKAFGSLAYDLGVSNYKENYIVSDFKSSITKTESGGDTY